MSILLNKKDGEYTYGDYLKWDDSQRWELIEGVPYCMTPAPTLQHQSILGEIYRQFANYLVGKTCQAFLAPFDVRLPSNQEADEDVKTVVQPDLTIACDRSMLRKTGCFGVPTLIVEIISPSSAKTDRIQKFNLYEKVGVKEYWIVQPDEKTISVFKLGNTNRYGRPTTYAEDHSIQVGIFPDLAIDLQTVFDY